MNACIEKLFALNFMKLPTVTLEIWNNFVSYNVLSFITSTFLGGSLNQAFCIDINVLIAKKFFITLCA